MKVKFANVVFNLDASCREVYDFYERYRTEDPCDEYISVTEEDLTKVYIMRNDRKRRKGAGWGAKEKDLVDEAIHKEMCRLFLNHGVLVFHGAAVSVDNRGYMFVAPHATGKSTHVRNWKRYFGDRMLLIDDDKLFVKKEKNGFCVYGSSWSKGSEPGMLGGVPLKAIVEYKHGSENIIKALDKKDALWLSMNHGYRGTVPGDLIRSMMLCAEIADKIPFASLSCINDISAVSVAYNYLREI
jgi:hypothetical protein